jgi:membrane fusion protein (multidrug efflux system)
MPDTPERPTPATPESPPPPAPPQEQGAPSVAPARRVPPWVRHRWIFIGVLAAAIAVGVFAVHYFSYAATHPNTDDATVDGDTVQVSAKITGRVLAVLVNGDQQVHKGQPLITLVPTDAKVLANQAAAAEAQAVAAEAQVRSAQANVVSAQANAVKAQRDYAREQMLFSAGAVAAQDLDAARAAEETTAAQDRAAAGQLAAAVDQQRAAAETARAQQLSAAEEAQETAITASANGVIADTVPVQAGQVVQPGQALMTLIPYAPRWIDADFKETQLQYVRVGQPASIHVDLLNQTFHGYVERVGPTTGSALSLLPPENATGNYVKVVQRVPVRIAIDDPHAGGLQIGLSVEVTIDTTQPGRTARAGR